MKLLRNGYTYKYPHPAVTTDCVILTFHEGKLKILLIRRGIEPFKGAWALPGGFLKMDESAEECAVRELREETGVTGCVIRQFHTFSAPGRDPRERVITIAFYALMKWQKATGADDAEFADWIPVDALPPLAFDHGEIVRMAMETIKRDIFFEPVGFDLLNDVFSMSELQSVYEAILGREFDRRNFAKKMKHMGILEEMKEETPLVEGVSESKKLPLPFLNNCVCDAEPEMDDACVTIKSEMSPMQSILPERDSSVKYHVPPPSSQKRSRSRKSTLFSLKRKNYDKLKDDNILEW